MSQSVGKPIQFTGEADFQNALATFLKTQGNKHLQDDMQRHEITKLALEMMLRQNDKLIGDLETKYKAKVDSYTARGGSLVGLPDINSTGNAASLDEAQHLEGMDLLKSVFTDKNNYKQGLIDNLNLINERIDQIDAIDSVISDTSPTEWAEGSEVFEKEDFWSSIKSKLGESFKGRDVLPIGFDSTSVSVEDKAISEDIGSSQYLNTYITNRLNNEAIAEHNNTLLERENRKLQYTINKAKIGTVYTDVEMDNKAIKTKMDNIDIGIETVMSPISQMLRTQQTFKDYTMTKYQRVNFEQGDGAEMTQDQLNKNELYQNLLATENQYLSMYGMPFAIAAGTTNSAYAGQELLEHVSQATPGKNKTPDYDNLISDFLLMQDYYGGLTGDKKIKYRQAVLSTYGLDLDADAFQASLSTSMQALDGKQDLARRLMQNAVGGDSASEAQIQEWYLSVMQEKSGNIQKTMLSMLRKYDLYKDLQLEDIDMADFQADLYATVQKAGTTPDDFGELFQTFLHLWKLDIEGGGSKYISKE
jgi:hypothetical protein